MKEFSGEIIGKVVTPVAYDGTEFRNMPLDQYGEYPVSLAAIPVGEIRLFVYDGSVWRPAICDGEGRLHTRVYEIAEGEVRLYVYDGAGWIPLLVDADGNLTVAVKSISTGQIKNYVYDGATWVEQKADSAGYTQVDISKLRSHDDVIPLHYHDRIARNQAFTATASVVSVYDTTCPAGEMWRIANIIYYNIGHAGTSWQLFLYAEGANILLAEISAPVANKKETFGLECWLKAGDYLWARFNGASVGDGLRMSVLGLVMLTP